MKKTLVSMMKKAGEKVAEIPVTLKSWPGMNHQPKMPEVLRQRMNEQSK